MKRIAAIVGVVLSVALVVGAFVLAGGDGSAEKSSPTTTEASNPPKDAVQAITNAGAKVQSLSPTKNESNDDDDDESDDDGDEGKYETSKVFVSVSPNTVRIGKEFKIEVRGFTPKTTVIVTIASAGYTPKVYEIKVDKNGKGKTKDIKSPTTAGVYSVVAIGPGKTGQPSKVASTTLTVVKKK